MAELLDWQKIEAFQKEFGLVNDCYLLGQAIHYIVHKDPINIDRAVSLLKQEIERLTTLKK